MPVNCRRIELLIRDSRDHTGNQSYGDNDGIPQRVWVRHFNDAQDRLFNRITQTHGSLYKKKSFLDIEAGEAEIDLPVDVYLRHNIQKVEFSRTGNAKDYVSLSLVAPLEEQSIPAYPDSYFLRDGVLVLSPIPNTSIANGIRLNYQYNIPRLDIRRAKISAVGQVGDTINTITLADDAYLTTLNETDLENEMVDYVCVVDKDGTIKAVAIPFGSYDSSTRVLTVDTGHDLSTDETVTVGDYIVFGSYSTTHCVLPPNCERYLQKYAETLVQIGSSNSDAVSNSKVLNDIEEDILASFETLEEDIFSIPLLTSEFMDWDE